MVKIKDLKKYPLLKNKRIIKLKLLKNQGVCNNIYKLETTQSKYLLRVFNHTHKNKKSRKNEFKIQKKAFENNIASKPYILDETNSLMICDFIKGKHKYKLKKSDLKNLIKTLKKLHKIKTNLKAFNLKEEFIYYKKKLKNDTSRKLIYSALSELNKVKENKKDFVLCHHDLNQQNIIFNKNKVFFIDWEFSCLNNKFFDIASLCIEFKLTKKQELLVLKYYFKNVKKKHIKTLKSYKIICSNLWKLWFMNLEKR